MFLFRFLLFILFSSIIYASTIKIDENTNALELLPSSYIYIDNTKKLTIKGIKNKQFKENKEAYLSYGYAPPFAVWVKFTLQNISNESIEKIIQYDHKITSNIKFYDGKKVFNEGINNHPKGRDTLNPIFHIKLKPKEVKTYYIRASSYITPLTVKLNLWNIKDIYAKSINNLIVLSIFFGAMGTLALYNLFIYFSTRDISYFWYVIYVFAITTHQVFYDGMIYKLDTNSFTKYIGTDGAYFVVTFPMIALTLFSKYFLNTKQYSKINNVLNFYLISIPILLIGGIFFSINAKWQNLFYISLILYLFFVACYAGYKKNRQAYFVIIGWFVLFFSWMLMYMASMGIFQIYEYYKYLVDFSILSEALLFSFALADRIKTANKEKELANKKLIFQQQSEEKRLKIEVENKTKDLTNALNEKNLLLDEKELLFKELHHRVKNNMQMVVSMIRLQSKRVDDERLKNIFQTAQNRINTMAHLHELLYKQDKITHINTLEYFTLIIDEIQETTNKNITINYDIQADLKMEQAIYCGLILNELISNATKYAFISSGIIDISLVKEAKTYNLKVEDNGIGFNDKEERDSLGLVLVNTLATKQLKGTIEFDTKKGTLVKITWKNDE